MIDNTTLLIETILRLKVNKITRVQLEEYSTRIYNALPNCTIKYKGKSIEDYEVMQRMVNNDYLIQSSRLLKEALKITDKYIEVVNKDILIGHGITR